jgi:hypothetical protein
MSGLHDFIGQGYLESFGITIEAAHADGICAKCRKTPTFHSDAGRREYRISALCEPCFDELFPEEEP